MLRQRHKIWVYVLFLLCFLDIKVFIYSKEVYEKKPVILALKSVKEKIECGEEVELISAYALPSDTYKVQEKWSYRLLFLEEEKVIFRKPKMFFAPGKYEVSLQIQNNKGVWSAPIQTNVTVKNKYKQSEIEYAVKRDIKGSILNEVGQTDYRKYECIEQDGQEEIPGKLIISNSPEKVKKTGILYEGTSKGVGRLLVHHLHAIPENQDYRIMVLATNLSEGRQSIQIKNLAMKGPSEDVLYVGGQLLLDYWDERVKEILYELPPGETTIIYKQDQEWKSGDAISAYMDFNTEGMVKWTVLCVKNGDNFESIKSYCEKDRHIRGTFESIQKNYAIHILEEKPAYLALGEDKQEYLKGYDEVTREKVVDRGDFGVQYEIKITADEDTAILLNPRGDVFRGAIEWKGKGIYPIPDKGCLKGAYEASFLGVAKKGEEVVLNYMLPNGSAAPVLMVFLPKSCW